jgi:orotidine 5'-phosphate decarboxylase subfamily 2
MESFGSRLTAAMDARGPLCVGIDPHPELLATWGLADHPNGLSTFVQTVIDALAERVAVLKPQAAFFERFGARGIAVLESAIGWSRAAGALVLLDGKRGDIGSTVAAYADAYLTPTSPLFVDAVTANPYLGVGALSPMVAAARAHGGGMFVLARTSNPEAAVCQTARTVDGRPVAQLVVDEISQLNEGFARPEQGPGALGSFGVVVGATVGDSGLDLSKLGGPILAPGLGAQGAGAADLRAVFGADLGRVLPSYSRAVLRAGPDRGDLRRAADRALADCLAVRAALG